MNLRKTILIPYITRGKHVGYDDLESVHFINHTTHYLGAFYGYNLTGGIEDYSQISKPSILRNYNNFVFTYDSIVLGKKNFYYFKNFNLTYF